MEENLKKEENAQLSYEQLNQVAQALQQRCMQAESRLNGINYTAMRLDYLFKVLNSSAKFPEDFIENCINEVVELLEIKEETPEEATEK